MGFLAKRTVVLGVGAGIAAYRACELARLLIKREATVHVALTPNAQRFVTPLTFQALTGFPVLSDLFDPRQDESFGHLAAGRAAELFVLAPATADLIARIRVGMADDAVTSTLLASGCPVLVAPAMNVHMWQTRQTQENVRALLADTRFSVVGPASGLLADGEVGPGRLAEPPEIVEAAEALLAPKDLQGWRVLVTAGPTREHLDPVRFISNPSTGRMGFAVARAAAQRGAQVTLVTGPSELPVPAGVEAVRVVAAEEMAAAALGRLEACDLFVAAAAVADQRPTTRLEQKAKKGPGEESLTLTRTPDILEQAGARSAQRGRPLLVGFAAETERPVENATEKLRRKRLDLIAVNDVTQPGSGFATPTNRLTLVDRNGLTTALPAMPKEDAAHALLERIVGLAGGHVVPQGEPRA